MNTPSIPTRLAALSLALLLCLAVTIPVAAAPPAQEIAMSPLTFVVEWVKAFFATPDESALSATSKSRDQDPNEPPSPDPEAGPLIIGNGLTASDTEGERGNPFGSPKG